jgi:purine-binding chemotaxis protein CheW
MSSTPSPAPAATASTATSGKYLTFQVGGEHYGIPVDRTREIIRVSTITGVPQMPAHVKGVINLRGRIVPVVDLRIRFGLANPEVHERTCIIVVHIASAHGGTSALGLMVDAVEEVVSLAAADVEPPPEVVARQEASHITGMAKIKGSLKTLLDLDRLLAA